MNRFNPLILSLAVATGGVTAPVTAQTNATFTVRQLAPETALKAVNAALAECRGRGFQVGVAVVDRSGIAQALIRDRLAGAHTVDTALNKAWTAASFRIDTLALANETQPGKPGSGIRHLPRVVAVGGGVPIESAGQLVGAIGVSGAPGGGADDECARAGISAIRDELDF